MENVVRRTIFLFALFCASRCVATPNTIFVPGDLAPGKELGGGQWSAADAQACSPAPETFAGLSIPTLDGNLDISPGDTSSSHLPLLITVLDRSNAASRHAWQDRDSLAALLEHSHPEVSFLFMSCSDADALSDAEWMRAQLMMRGLELGWSGAQVVERMQRFHFGTASAAALPPGSAWLSALLRDNNWTTARRVLRAHVDGGHVLLEASRLDAAYEWVPWPLPRSATPLEYAGRGCDWPPSPELNGSVALVRLDSFPAPGTPCTWPHMLARAEAAGVRALVAAAPPGFDVAQIGCSGDAECGVSVDLPVTMVLADAGRALHRARLGSGRVTVEFAEQPGPGLFVGLDHAGQLVELGWPTAFPDHRFLVWAARWQAYLQRLGARLARPALVVPLFNGTAMAGASGASVTLRLPPPRALSGYDRMALDMRLGCPGPFDASCPEWDHLVQLFASCEGAPGAEDPCAPTVWQPRPRAGDTSVAPPGAGHASSASTNVSCGRELGRWVTPFRRRVGRWVTDVSALAPLLRPGAVCTFRVQSTAWSGVWMPTLSLRFSRSGTRGAVALWPPRTALLPLPFAGGTFDHGYNARQRTFHFRSPPGLRRAIVVALITGHGSDEHNCAEFCPTQHVFVVNGITSLALSVNFSRAGTTWGCADQVSPPPHTHTPPHPEHITQKHKHTKVPKAAKVPPHPLVPCSGVGRLRPQPAWHVDVWQGWLVLLRCQTAVLRHHGRATSLASGGGHPSKTHPQQHCVPRTLPGQRPKPQAESRRHGHEC